VTKPLRIVTTAHARDLVPSKRRLLSSADADAADLAAARG
jgi:hypothetical protein